MLSLFSSIDVFHAIFSVLLGTCGHSGIERLRASLASATPRIGASSARLHPARGCIQRPGTSAAPQYTRRSVQPAASSDALRCNQQRVATLRGNQQRRASEQPAATRFGATSSDARRSNQQRPASEQPATAKQRTHVPFQTVTSPPAPSSRRQSHRQNDSNYDVPAQMHPWTAAKVYRLHVKIQRSHVQATCQNSMLRCTGFAHLRSGERTNDNALTGGRTKRLSD